MSNTVEQSNPEHDDKIQPELENSMSGEDKEETLAGVKAQRDELAIELKTVKGELAKVTKQLDKLGSRVDFLFEQTTADNMDDTEAYRFAENLINRDIKRLELGYSDLREIVLLIEESSSDAKAAKPNALAEKFANQNIKRLEIGYSDLRELILLTQDRQEKIYKENTSKTSTLESDMMSLINSMQISFSEIVYNLGEEQEHSASKSVDYTKEIKKRLDEKMSALENKQHKDHGDTKDNLSSLRVQLSDKITKVQNDLINELKGIQSELVNNTNGVASDLTNTINAIQSDLTNTINAIQSDLTNNTNAVQSELTNRIIGIESELTSSVVSVQERLNQAQTEMTSSISSVQSELRDLVRNTENDIRNLQANYDRLNNDLNSIYSIVTENSRSIENFKAQLIKLVAEHQELKASKENSLRKLAQYINRLSVLTGKDKELERYNLNDAMKRLEGTGSAK